MTSRVMGAGLEIFVLLSVAVSFRFLSRVGECETKDDREARIYGNNRNNGKDMEIFIIIIIMKMIIILLLLVLLLLKL